MPEMRYHPIGEDGKVYYPDKAITQRKKEACNWEKGHKSLLQRDFGIRRQVSEIPRTTRSYYTTGAREKHMRDLSALVILGQMNRQKDFGPDLAGQVIFNDIQAHKYTKPLNPKSLEALEPSYRQDQLHVLSQMASPSTAWDKVAFNITEVVNGSNNNADGNREGSASMEHQI